MSGTFRKSVSLGVFALVLTGCSHSGGSSMVLGSCRSIGLCDDPPLVPVDVELLCDATLGSTCNSHALEVLLDRVLPYASHRPGSEVKLWWLASDVAATRMVADLAVPDQQHSGPKARETQARRWAESGRAYFTKAIESSLAQRPGTRSPIAEGISKIVLSMSTTQSGRQRLLIIVSDAREFSPLGDFECGALPTQEQFARVLRRDLLQPGSLAGTRVVFAFVAAGPLGGRPCRVEIWRERRIRELWTGALMAAGASNVTFSAEMPPLE